MFCWISWISILQCHKLSQTEKKLRRMPLSAGCCMMMLGRVPQVVMRETSSKLPEVKSLLLKENPALAEITTVDNRRFFSPPVLAVQ